MTSFKKQEWLSSQYAKLSIVRVAYLLIFLALSPSAFASFVLHEYVGGAGANLPIVHGSTITRTYLDIEMLEFLTASGTGTDNTPFTTSAVSSDNTVVEYSVVVGSGPASPWYTTNLIRFKTAGTATVTFTRRRNSDAAVLEQATVTFVITPSHLTIQANDKTRLYGMPNPLLNGTVLGLPPSWAAFSTEPTYSTTAGPNSPVGPYPITVSGAVTYPRYVLDPSINGTLTVTPAPLTLTVGNAGRTYGSANPAFSATYTGLAPGETGATALVTQPALATSAATNSPVGTYPITATGAVANANYSLQPPVNGTLTVGPAPLTITVENANRVYGDVNPTFSATYTGLAPGETPANAMVTQPVLSSTALPSSPPGNYLITPGAAVANSNYSLAPLGSGILTVVRRPLTVGGQNASRPYGSANPPLTTLYLGLAPGETSAHAFITQPTLISYATATSPPGNYSINVLGGTATPNYLPSYPSMGVLTVERAPLTMTVENATRIYGGADPVFSATYAGLVPGETIANALTTLPTLGTSATATSPVGTYPITASGAVESANYSLQAPVNGTLAITPASLTVKAEDATRVYGAADPAFSATYEGLVAGDTAATALTTPPTLGTSATITSPVGTYAITASGAVSNANYSLGTPVGGVLTVTPATLVITAANASRVAGAANPAFSAITSGWVNGETDANLVTQPVFSTTATPNSPPGTYPIIASGADASNYAISYEAGTLTVTAAPLTAPVPVPVNSGWLLGALCALLGGMAWRAKKS
ncbi:MBG domain-containing protein [Ottowia thiooxydans]|uniref:MBG domain-containing protein n=1 Tax=Ottowia thiooxydans TaxID=219182 RepID=A0ABV2QGU1_9BURK